jgi:S-adenosylmethionine hydrolase
MKLVGMLTDFGLEQEYVGVCKAVMKNISPQIELIDISHNVEKFNVREGALMLLNFGKYSPQMIYLAVVDPGVGSERNPLVIESERGDILVGPDNGLLVPLARSFGIKQAVVITNRKYMLSRVSRTFHARDIFSPVCAYLTLGIPVEDFGKPINESALTDLSVGNAEWKNGAIQGRVLRIDVFGNIQTNIDVFLLERVGMKKGDQLVLKFSDRHIIIPFVESFTDVPPNELLFHIDSDDLLSLSLNMGSAHDFLGVLEDMEIKVWVR